MSCFGRRIRNCAGAFAMVALAGATSAMAQTQKRPITFNDLISMHRVSDPQISPDGNWVAYAVSTPDVEANHSVSNIWIVPANGGDERQLTRSGSDLRPRWSPDGKRIAFLSSRSGEQQVYTISLYGGEAQRLTFLSTGADNELWSPDGKWMAFVSRVYPDCRTDGCNKSRDEATAKNKVKAHIATHLLYRHWTDWADGKRSHLFVIAITGKSGTSVDLTPGADYDVPPFNLGAPEAIAFSPDSRELCFTADTDKDEALSTNGDLFTVPVLGGAQPKRITTNKGDDWGPAYSPDGKWIAYRSQAMPGYESDRWRLMIYNRATGEHKDLTPNFDRNVDSYIWAPDSQTIYFPAENQAEMPVYSVTLGAAANAAPPEVIRAGFNSELSISSDGKRLVFRVRA